MDYYLSKLFIAAFNPLGTALLLLLGAGLTLWCGRRRVSLILIGAASAWLWLWATPLASYGLRRSIEADFPSVHIDQVPAAGAIVIFGGAVSPPHIDRATANLTAASDRIWHAARLFRSGKAPLLLVSGGSDPVETTTPEAQVIGSLLQELGVPAEALLIEDQSRTTRENAAFSARLLGERGIDHVLLVTSALHMRRAQRLLAAHGLRVTPAATDYEAGSPSAGAPLLRWIPDTGALDGSSRAIKELLGRSAGR